MKRRHIILIAAIISLLGVSLLLAIFHTSNQKNPNGTLIQPTPVSFNPKHIINTQSPDQDFIVERLSPANNSVNISLHQQIVVTFNKPVSINEISYSLLPETNVKTTSQDNNLIITPLEELQPGTRYSMILRLNRPNDPPNLFQYIFTTSGPTPTVKPDDFVSGTAQKEEATQRQSYPDVFLANKTPYSSKNFSVSSDYKMTPTGHFYFIVTLREDQTTSQAEFIKWVQGLGLTDIQIQSLDITYQ